MSRIGNTEYDCIWGFCKYNILVVTGKKKAGNVYRKLYARNMEGFPCFRCCTTLCTGATEHNTNHMQSASTIKKVRKKSMSCPTGLGQSGHHEPGLAT